MKSAASIYLLVFISIQIFSTRALAEPWLSNRFSQNCAGCHAPGRYNRAPEKRRCTLSCQGCHVNPNGGGLRNEYGKWNSQRWLRSFESKLAWSAKSVAPFEQQRYHDIIREENKVTFDKRREKVAIQRGRAIVEQEGLVTDESLYDRTHEHYADPVPSEAQQLYMIPENDPYRLERNSPYTAGADFRYLYIKQSGDIIPENRESINWPMGLDVGVRVKPLKKHVSLVYEARATNSNLDQPSEDYLFSSGNVSTRSAYVLIDDLPYNSYVQYGQYRPLFGHYNPDHENLFAGMTGLSQNATYKAVGIGTAPNVPFAMINLIQSSSNPANNQEKGFVVTAGLRFVTLGASLVGSYWKTEEDEDTKTMYNVNGGFNWKRLVVNADYTRASLKTASGGEDAGSVITLETKFRFWREMYLMANYSTSNVAPIQSLAPGDGKQIEFGAKAFTLSGIELEALWFKNEINIQAVPTPIEFDGLQFQAHLYF